MGEIDKILEKCVGNELPPCQAACPLHVDVKGYINLIKHGEVEEALRLVYEKLPFPGTMGRICTHPCEVRCRRKEIGGPIAIASLKRFIADSASVNEDSLIAPLPENRRERVAIVGAGPAGLMAAYDLRRLGYQVTVFEASPFLGGTMRMAVPSYRLPRAVLAQEIKQIQELGVNIRTNTRVEHLTELLEQGYEAIFLATGAQLSKKLDLPGKDLEGVLWGVDFLREVNLEHKVIVKGKILVIGGGNVAIDVALTALRLGAKEIELACVESREEMPAFEWEIQQALEEGIHLNVSWAPTNITEDKDNKRVTGVEFVRCTSIFDEEGMFNPSFDESVTTFIPADTVIMAIGQAPDLFYLKGEGVRTVRGLISADGITLQTSLPQVFAGGDAVTGPGAVIEALAAGRRAATSIDHYLQGEEISLEGEGEGSKESKLEANIEGIASEERTTMPLLPLQQRDSFNEIELGFGEEQALQEAERCLQCECKLCIKNCEFLTSVCETPRELAERFKSGFFKERPDIPYSCNLCGLCKRLCPEGLDMGQMCMDLRQQLVSEKLAPLPQHQAVISEQEWAASEFFLSLNGSEPGQPKRFFFPGCGLSASSPDIVMKTHAYLKEKLPSMGIILGCCGAPSHMIVDHNHFHNLLDKISSQMREASATELIVACPDCYHNLKENAPDIPLRSVYEVMAEYGLPEGAVKAKNGKTFAIHDSCKARYETNLQDSVRAIVQELGYNIEEMEFSRDMTRCCGLGGMASYVNYKLVNKVTRRRANETPFDMLSYCSSCRGNFAMVGKRSVHILDLVFNPAWEETAESLPVLGESRHKNQLWLRQQLIQ